MSLPKEARSNVQSKFHVSEGKEACCYQTKEEGPSGTLSLRDGKIGGNNPTCSNHSNPNFLHKERETTLNDKNFISKPDIAAALKQMMLKPSAKLVTDTVSEEALQLHCR